MRNRLKRLRRSSLELHPGSRLSEAYHHLVHRAAGTKSSQTAPKRPRRGAATRGRAVGQRVAIPSEVGFSVQIRRFLRISNSRFTPDLAFAIVERDAIGFQTTHLGAELDPLE